MGVKYFNNNIQVISSATFNFFTKRATKTLISCVRPYFFFFYRIRDGSVGEMNDRAANYTT